MPQFHLRHLGQWHVVGRQPDGLTHIGYVHRKTIGSGDPQQHLSAKMTTIVSDHGVKFIRWMLDSVPPQTYVKTMGFTTNVDRWQEFEFIAPGTDDRAATRCAVNKRKP
jgi:hypothetical protein